MFTNNNQDFINGIKKQQTFVMIKPDGVQRNLIGEIITRIEKVGLKIVEMEMKTARPETILAHYPSEDKVWLERVGTKTLGTFEELGIDASQHLPSIDKLEIGNAVMGYLVDYMTSGPIVVMVVEGNLSVAMMRKMVGATIPITAERGTIRGDFSVDTPLVANIECRPVLNLIHASETVEEAQTEIKLWFGK